MQRKSGLFLRFAVVVTSIAALAQSPLSKSTRDYTGRVFNERLRHIASPSGENSIDCGATTTVHADDSVAACGGKAFQSHKPFFLAYYDRTDTRVDFAYGLAEDAAGNVFAVTYEPPGFPPVDPNRHTQVMDDNQTRVSECIKPVTLEKTRQGLLACITPVNEEESARAEQQEATETTVCAIVEDPPAFNNKMVRIRGHYSGSFEYSLLSGDGCGAALWFRYGGGGSPPTLFAYVGGGGTRPGAEDTSGKYIRPVPVNLVRDAKFDRFEKVLMHGDKAGDASATEKARQVRFTLRHRNVHRKNRCCFERSPRIPQEQFIRAPRRWFGIWPYGHVRSRIRTAIRRGRTYFFL